jgi:hypothetical protein
VRAKEAWSRTRALSNEELLEALRLLLRERGYLTERLIDKNGNTPTSPTYTRRFGSLLKAYELIGYVPPKRGNGYTGGRGQRTGDSLSTQ